MTANRAGFWLGAVGAALVLAAIPTDSRLIVLIGLILVVLAHVTPIVAYVLRRRA